MIDLDQLFIDLFKLESEAERYGMSKSLRDRLAAARTVLPAIEAERDKRS